MTIARIISGGQTGVDIAALRAAKSHGIPTGGTMPKGFRTLVGPRPEWAREFWLHEHVSPAYPPRTYQNVRDADVTVQIALNWESPGEVLTARAIKQYRKPSAEIPIRFEGPERQWRAPLEHLWASGETIVHCAREHRRGVCVNFAGNSESTAPGIEAFAEGLIRELLNIVRIIVEA